MRPTAKVSEQVNSKCCPSNTILQLSTPYTTPILSYMKIATKTPIAIISGTVKL